MDRSRLSALDAKGSHVFFLLAIGEEFGDLQRAYIRWVRVCLRHLDCHIPVHHAELPAAEQKLADQSRSWQ